MEIAAGFILFLVTVIGKMAVGQETTMTPDDAIDTVCPPDNVEAKNKALVLEFLQAVFGDKDVDAVDRYIDPNIYIQHNPTVADGREALKTAAKVWFKDGHKEKVDVQRVAADGDLVWVHLRSKKGEKVTSYIDIFRLKDYKIVEHWDVQQVVPEKAENSHPFF